MPISLHAKQHLVAKAPSRRGICALEASHAWLERGNVLGVALGVQASGEVPPSLVAIVISTLERLTDDEETRSAGEEAALETVGEGEELEIAGEGGGLGDRRRGGGVGDCRRGEGDFGLSSGSFAGWFTLFNFVSAATMEMPSALAIAIAFDNKLPSVSGFLGSAAASSVFTGSGALPLSFFFDFFSMAPSSSRLRFFFPIS